MVAAVVVVVGMVHIEPVVHIRQANFVDTSQAMDNGDDDDDDKVPVRVLDLVLCVLAHTLAHRTVTHNEIQNSQYSVPQHLMEHS